MNISGITTKFNVELLSGLANNDSSIIPMAVKDFISNCAIVDTYRKEGGADDAREKAIEEFGTGAVWLFGIPSLKALINKTIYPVLGLDSNFDVTLLKDKNKLNKIKETLENSKNSVLEHEKEVFSSLDKKNAFLNLTNAQLYKGLSFGKFVTSTVVSAVALSKIISYKQKTTQKRIEKDVKKEKASKVLLNNSVGNNITFRAFSDKKQNKTNLSFKGLSKIPELFMYNPIANTFILDGVITSGRLIKARKGEKKEVALKEAFQIIFIYAIAKPVQCLLEKAGKMFNLPIELDPKVLFMEDAKNKIEEAQKIIKENNAISQINKNGKNINKLNPEFVEKIYKMDVKSPLIEILEKNGVINLVRNKDNSKQAVSYMKNIDEAALLKTLENINPLAKNIKNLNGIKLYKTISVLGNVAFAALVMGVVQPLIAIKMRKVLNNGDNRNPAIVAQENEMKAQENKN